MGRRRTRLPRPAYAARFELCFKGGPALLGPRADGFFVALGGAEARLLGAPAARPLHRASRFSARLGEPLETRPLVRSQVSDTKRHGRLPYRSFPNSTAHL